MGDYSYQDIATTEMIISIFDDIGFDKDNPVSMLARIMAREYCVKMINMSKCTVEHVYCIAQCYYDGCMDGIGKMDTLKRKVLSGSQNIAA